MFSRFQTFTNLEYLLMDRMPAKDVDGFMRRLKLILLIVCVAAALPLVALVVYLDRRIASFEQSLSYRDPREPKDGAVVLGTLPFDPVSGQTVYVPAYSHVYHEDGKPYLLTVTLSVRNADPDGVLTLSSVRYLNTQGREVRSFLDTPLNVGPLASTDFLVEREDATGGTGANFLVEWVSDKPIVPPVIETVMIDTAGTQGISFVRSGTVIKERGTDPPRTAPPSSTASDNP